MLVSSVQSSSIAASDRAAIRQSIIKSVTMSTAAETPVPTRRAELHVPSKFRVSAPLESALAQKNELSELQFPVTHTVLESAATPSQPPPPPYRPAVAAVAGTGTGADVAQQTTTSAVTASPSTTTTTTTAAAKRSSLQNLQSTLIAADRGRSGAASVSAVVKAPVALQSSSTRSAVDEMTETDEASINASALSSHTQDAEEVQRMRQELSAARREKEEVMKLLETFARAPQQMSGVLQAYLREQQHSDGSGDPAQAQPRIMTMPSPVVAPSSSSSSSSSSSVSKPTARAQTETVAATPFRDDRTRTEAPPSEQRNRSSESLSDDRSATSASSLTLTVPASDSEEDDAVSHSVDSIVSSHLRGQSMVSIDDDGDDDDLRNHDADPKVVHALISCYFLDMNIRIQLSVRDLRICGKQVSGQR